MASTQETIRTALGESVALQELVGDRLYPGQIPDDETETPWLYYAVPESAPMDDLDGGGHYASDFEFHALADTYAEAKAVIDAVYAALEAYTGGQVGLALWVGTSEEVTDDGYHHVVRFRIWGSNASITHATGSRARILTSLDTITLIAGETTITINDAGLFLNGVEFEGEQGPQGDQGPQGEQGEDGADGDPGPNEVTTATATNLTGFLYGNGSTVVATAQAAYATSGDLVTITSGAAGDTPITIKAHASQSAHLSEWLSSANALLLNITSAGRIVGGTGNLGLQAGTGSGGNSINLIDDNGTTRMQIGRDAEIQMTSNFRFTNDTTYSVGRQDNSRPLGVYASGRIQVNFGSAHNTAGLNATPLIAASTSASAPVSIVSGAASQTGVMHALWGTSSTSLRPQAEFDTAWADSTDATRKARLLVRVWDTAAREIMRGEASGSAPMIGFLGATASARPTVSGSRGGNAALASLLTALATLGLITDSSSA